MPYGSSLPSSPPPFYQGGSGDLICIWEKEGGGKEEKQISPSSLSRPPFRGTECERATQ